jgi:hypothetical protein
MAMVFRDICSANYVSDGDGNDGGDGDGAAVPSRPADTSCPVGFIRINLDPAHAQITPEEVGFANLDQERRREFMKAHCVSLAMQGLQALREVDARLSKISNSALLHDSDPLCGTGSLVASALTRRFDHLSTES